MQMIINLKQLKDIGWSWVSAKTLLFERNYSNSSRKSFLRNESSKEKSIKYTPLPLRSCVILNEIRKNWPTLQSNRLFEMVDRTKTQVEKVWWSFFSSNVQNATKCTLEQHTDQPNVQDKVITQPNVQDKTKPNMQDTTQLKN